MSYTVVNGFANCFEMADGYCRMKGGRAMCGGEYSNGRQEI